MATRDIDPFATPVPTMLKGRLSTPERHPDLECPA